MCGVGDNLKWYHILYMCIAFGVPESYFWLLRRTHDTFDRLCDNINTTIHRIQTTSRTLLQLSNLAPNQAFTRFGDFPLEIQRLIWHFASQEPRTVELRRSSRDYLLKQPYIEPRPGIWSIAQVPPVLHTCREARLEGLKSYELAFGTHELEARVYVNFAVDVVFMGRRCPVENMVNWDRPGANIKYRLLEKDCEKIRRLAIRFERSWDRVVQVWDREKFGGVREVIIVGQRSGQRTFDLGISPDLRVRGEKGGEGIAWGEIQSTESGFGKLVRVRILEDRVGEWGEEFGKSGGVVRKDVLVRDGTFVKGLRDKWFSPRRSWIF